MIKYYVVVVQQTPNGENRSVPKVYNTLTEATTEFHVQLGKDGNNTNVVESVCIIFDSNGMIHRSEKVTGKATTTTEPTE